MGIFSKFTDTIFIKESSELQKQYEALQKLYNYYPNNEELKQALYMAKKGVEGENEIAYQLKKSSIGMYVLRDLNYEYQDLTAQIDYLIITSHYRYLIECKNLIGNITVNEKGDFIREYTYNGRKIRKGMYSPLRQVEAQREVMRKISEQDQKWSLANTIYSLFDNKDTYNKWRRVLVVAANPETILDTSKAPKDIKYKVLRADGLIRQIEYDIKELNDEYPLTQKQMLKIANAYLEMNKEFDIDYYEFFKEKFKLDQVNFNSEVSANGTIDETVLTPPTSLENSVLIPPVPENAPLNQEVLKSPAEINDEKMKEELLKFRKETSKIMEIPPYYIFNNEELDIIMGIKPRTKDELKKALPAIKVKCHGDKIIEIIKKYPL